MERVWETRLQGKDRVKVKGQAMQTLARTCVWTQTAALIHYADCPRHSWSVALILVFCFSDFLLACAFPWHVLSRLTLHAVAHAAQ